MPELFTIAATYSEDYVAGPARQNPARKTVHFECVDVEPCNVATQHCRLKVLRDVHADEILEVAAWSVLHS